MKKRYQIILRTIPITLRMVYSHILTQELGSAFLTTERV